MQLPRCNFKTKKWAVVNSKLKVPVNFSVLVFNGHLRPWFICYIVCYWCWCESGRKAESGRVFGLNVCDREWSLLASEFQSLQPCSPLMKDRSKSHSQPRTPRTDTRTQDGGKVSNLFSSLSFRISCFLYWNPKNCYSAKQSNYEFGGPVVSDILNKYEIQTSWFSKESTSSSWNCKQTRLSRSEYEKFSLPSPLPLPFLPHPRTTW